MSCRSARASACTESCARAWSRTQSGRLTGRLEGANCRGPEKAQRLRAWLEAAGLADAEVWAYGDSSGDAELLRDADHPVWVRRVEILPEPLG